LHSEPSQNKTNRNSVTVKKLRDGYLKTLFVLYTLLARPPLWSSGHQYMCLRDGLSSVWVWQKGYHQCRWVWQKDYHQCRCAWQNDYHQCRCAWEMDCSQCVCLRDGFSRVCVCVCVCVCVSLRYWLPSVCVCLRDGLS
jgi:hypothetical protein